MMDIIRRRSIVLILLFLVFLFSTQNYFILLSLGTMNNNIICKPSERRALLSFKQHLKNSSDSLSSWSGENCCSSWAGVVCSSNTTDHHVVQLHLQQLGLGGELNPSLLELKQLRHLDLSLNDFHGIRIPDFLGSLQSLRYLDLSNAGFSGMIPHQLGNLSNLRYLDLSLSYDELTVVGNFQWISHLSSLKHLGLSNVYLKNAFDFQWISHLSSLEHLDLSRVYLKNASNWFRVVNMLPSLLVLRLSGCGLSGALPTTTSLSHVNFTSLQVLDLSSNNYFNSTLPEWIYSLTNLQQLDLTDNSFQGTISPSIGNLTNLQQLDLSWNSFQGTISPSIGNLTKLTLLDLSSNLELEGEIPRSIGYLCNLRILYLSSNKLQGTISPSIGNLTNLQQLDLSSNQLSGPLPEELGRLSLLEMLDLRNNKLNGSLPESLGNLSKLGSLDMAKNAFEGIVSEVHFANLTNLRQLVLISLVLNVSHEWVPPFQLLDHVDLRNCQLGPGFPVWLRTQKSLAYLDLSMTGISGTIPTWFWNFTTDHFITLDLSHNELYGELPKLINATTISLKFNQFSGQLPRVSSNVYELDLSNNSFSGPISTFLCNPMSKNNDLTILDLSDNFLSGNLSDCWVYWASLFSIRLGENKISGKIPSSMGSLHKLQALHLGDNSLSGELPSSLRNCTSFRSIDFGENEFTGRLPIWLGESFQEIQVLRLRSNKFDGEIPLEFCYLAFIRVLDIAHNDLRGSIPKCFNKFSAIATNIPPMNFSKDVDRTPLVTKGRELEFSATLLFFTSLDLSKNSLSGEIPEELTSLLGLISLNLSENRFIGKIPEKIGNMYSLESIDLSKNRISGVIPRSISNLSFLGYLDLSYNNLSGKIPSSTQLQSFNESSFIGNQELCGPPLKNCSREDLPQKPGDIGDRADEDWFDMKWFYMSMGVGFAVGFWAFWGVMVLKSSWRIAYFRFLDDTKDKLCLLF